MHTWWEWALVTRGANLLLPGAVALIVGVLVTLVRRRLARRTAAAIARRFAKRALRVSSVDVGGRSCLEGTLEIDGGPVRGLRSDAPVAVTSALVHDDGEASPLAHLVAPGLALRVEDGRVALRGPIALAWSDPERAPSRLLWLRRRVRARLEAAGPSLAGASLRAPIAVRELAVGARVVVEGTLEADEGESYRDGTARALVGDPERPLVIVASNVRPPGLAPGPTLAATVLSFAMAAYGPSVWLRHAGSPGLFDEWAPAAAEALVFLTPWRGALVATLANRERPRGARALRAWALVQLARGECDVAMEALAESALPIDDPAFAACPASARVRVAAARRDARFDDAEAIAALPGSIFYVERARMHIEAGDFAGAADLLGDEHDTSCPSLAVRGAGGSSAATLRWRAHDRDPKCATALFALDPTLATTPPASYTASEDTTQLLSIDAPTAPRSDAYLEATWPSGEDFVLSVPEICDALCIGARHALESGSASPQLHARMLAAELGGAIASGDRAIFERDVALVAPHVPARAAAMRTAWAILWEPPAAAHEALAAVPAGDDQRQLALILTTVESGEGLYPVMRARRTRLHDCDDGGCTEQTRLAGRMGDARGGWTELGGAVLAARLARSDDTALVEGMRHRRVPLEARIEELLGAALVERGVARILHDDAWGAELDARIARYQAVVQDRLRAVMLRLIDWAPY